MASKTPPRQRRSRRYYDWLWPLVAAEVRRGLPLTQACERVLARNASRAWGERFGAAFYQAMARRQRAEEQEATKNDES